MLTSMATSRNVCIQSFESMEVSTILSQFEQADSHGRDFSVDLEYESQLISQFASYSQVSAGRVDSHTLPAAILCSHEDLQMN